MGKLIVELSEETHKALKHRAALNHRTIKRVVTELLEEYLLRGEEKKRPKETGFCGAWGDARTAEAIILDIKTHRHWFGKGRGKGA